ncbi:MAG: hypothetical protein A2W61_08400 [Deltaproteobacteria bacterium RIFCSPLOWO2_01_44_7]|nr:MAG: hypothetical protein A2712_03535 [Deltaproteobacteria bacterium RIFCSPHIGHO2_01_FULL_43_49]OGQ16264.1 MAG: hypothetical protein A3D22_01505 [Deltaproteobacteria bacterium RIFCSPHIGHO2_02_FULL_44_53]OGQ29224.1 MAG: hypothetical protein A3D98_05290 [Deltaproteobacteria bacterium RIFCSPHIGHO2_12_FULL_44_21]OGQ32781.1 MAG: hypothetical protein A2979_09435 [Deltaproteobacteria bacterium RIFCSPLOWO2_01_FULL_45_74]OGQ41883.1 MAG: hypothetical protein A3I70_09220 [Deltaproteobacteria bacterium 
MKSISVSIEVCEELAEITGWRQISSFSNEGCPFAFLFESLLVDYPEILERYPPEAEVLAFTVNGVAPTDFGYPLQNGDNLRFWIQRGALAFH